VPKEPPETSDIDSLLHNAAGCRTRHCGTFRGLYQAAYAEDLPDGPQRFLPDLATQSFAGHMQSVHEARRDIRPDVPWLDHYGPQGSRSMALLRTYTDAACSEPAGQRTAIDLGEQLGRSSAVASLLGRSLLPGGPQVVCTHACGGMHSSNMTLPEHEYPYWPGQVAAYGGSIRHALTSIPNAQHDHRILQRVASFSDVPGKHEDTLASTERLAPIAADPCSKSLEQTGTAELDNVIHALLHYQILLTFRRADQLTDKRAAGTDMAELLNVCRLSDAAVAGLQRYAARCGGHMTSFDTGAYDETGCRGSAPTLADQHEVRCSRDHVRGSSASTMRGEDAEHPLPRGVGPTDLSANGQDLIQATSDVSVTPALVLPFGTPQAAGTPERASIPARWTGNPLVVCRRRSVFSCGEIECLVWKYRLPDHGDLLADAIVAVRAQPLVVTIGGPDAVRLSICRQVEGYVIHLVSEMGTARLSTPCRSMASARISFQMSACEQRLSSAGARSRLWPIRTICCLSCPGSTRIRSCPSLSIIQTILRLSERNTGAEHRQDQVGARTC